MCSLQILGADRIVFPVQNMSISPKDWGNGRMITGKGRQENGRYQDRLNKLRTDLESFVDELDYPITYGGNVDNIETMERIYKIGFDKISLNSSLFLNNNFVKEASLKFGKQSIVASIDVKLIDNDYYCFYNNGKISSNLKIEDHIQNIIDNDYVSELLITCIDNEGTFKGFNYELYNKIKNFNIRIIANGGGDYNENNIIQTININNIYGLGFSSLFFFKQYTPLDVKKILKNNDILCVNNN